MRRIFLVLSLAGLALHSVAYGNDLVIKPTTTLVAQTSNNTSAADAFQAQANGNSGSGNISKLDLHSLLYPGNHTKIYAHLMAWFGGSNHMNVGYSSTDGKQVARQIQDMVSRGIDGVIIDWYGKGTTSDQATLLVMKEAEAHPGFTFAVMIDTGAIKNNSCSGCTPQQALVKHLQYIEQTYFASPAYMRISGKPIVTNFDIDLSFQIDWKAAKSTLSSDPTFIFQSNAGFTHAVSGGSYSWVKPTTTDYGANYLASFYKTGKSYRNLQTVGATYKGFNDKLALWGLNRVMDQQCGQTWLQTFAKINSMYDSGNQLDSLQLVTWNDYEEGTEIESGIDNCVSLSLSLSTNSLNWKVTGQENTLDHYRIYISPDGKNLMSLTDVNTGNNSLNLCSFSLAAGNYQLFVQAVGKPNLRNKISPPVAYSPKCGGGAGTGTTATGTTGTSSTGTSTTGTGTTGTGSTGTTVANATIQLQAMPSALNIHTGHSATTTIIISSTSGSVATPISFACSNLPIGMACAFSPASVSDSGNVTSLLSVSVGPVSSAFNDRKHLHGIFYASLFAFGMAGFVGIGQVKRKRVFAAALIMLLISVTVLLTSCGGMDASSVKTGASYTINIGGTSGGTQMSAATMSVSVE